MKKTNEEFVAQIADRAFEALEEYMGALIKITFKCSVCGHEWSARPSDILNGSGCPEYQHRNEILKDFGDGSVLIDISTKKHPLATSRMDLADLVKIKGRIHVRGDDGYPSTVVNGKLKQVHQVVMSNPPEGKQVDHVNRVRTDNRRSNLQFVTHQENMTNKSKYKTNTSGTVGVSWHKRDEVWQAEIQIEGKKKYLGSFTSLSEAKAARKAAEELIGD